MHDLLSGLREIAVGLVHRRPSPLKKEAQHELGAVGVGEEGNVAQGLGSGFYLLLFQTRRLVGQPVPFGLAHVLVGVDGHEQGGIAFGQGAGGQHPVGIALDLSQAGQAEMLILQGVGVLVGEGYSLLGLDQFVLRDNVELFLVWGVEASDALGLHVNQGCGQVKVLIQEAQGHVGLPHLLNILRCSFFGVVFGQALLQLSRGQKLKVDFC